MTSRSAYPSDLCDAPWALIEPRLTVWRQSRAAAGVSGRTPTHDLREIFNARGTGQLQEDIIERGPAQPDVADADLRPAQLGGRSLHQQEPVARGREGEAVRALVRLRLAAAHPGE